VLSWAGALRWARGHDAPAAALVLLGAAAATALAAVVWFRPHHGVPFALLTGAAVAAAIAAGVPTAVAAVAPRRVGAAALAAWICGTAAILPYDRYHTVAAGALVGFGVAVLALIPVGGWFVAAELSRRSSAG
jgi:hypothetical protein